MYYNGVLQGSVTLGVAPAVYAVVLGPGRYSYDCGNAYSYESFNYTAAHLAVYAYQLTPQRITAHYNTGYSGSTGTSAAQRFAQILSWGQLGLKRGYYWWQGTQAQGQPEITKIGPAYSLNGSSAADAVHQVEQDEGGQSLVQANGSYVYTERWGGYNQQPQVTFGDAALPSSGPLNTPVTFSGGLGEWAPNTGSCTLTLAQGPQPGVLDEGPVYYGTASALLTPLGAGAGYTFAAVNSGSFPAGPGQRFLAQAWVWSGLGYPTIQVGCDWFDINGEYLTSSLGTATAPAGRVGVRVGGVLLPRRPGAAGGGRADAARDEREPDPGELHVHLLRRVLQVTGQVPVPEGNHLRLRQLLPVHGGADHPAGRAEPADHRRPAEPRGDPAVLPPVSADVHVERRITV